MEIRKDFYSKEQLRDFLRKKTWIYEKKPTFLRNYLVAISPIVLLGGYISWDFLLKGDYITMITVWIFPLGMLAIAYLGYMQKHIYQGLSDFLTLKDSIIREKSKLDIYIKDDIQNFGININIVGDIKHCISSILKGYKLILKSHRYIQKNTWYLALNQEQEGQKFINNVIAIELKWIINYSQEFTTLVQSWISHHATELAELEKQIQAQELATESENGKGALELSRISLQEHLKELEKVRV